MVSEEVADMHGDALGLVLSVSLIALCLGLSFAVIKMGKGRLGSSRAEIARKIVHIGVSNWFFIYYYVFESAMWPILGLTAFAILNALLNVSGGFHVLMGQESTKRNWGLVQYPIAIIVLIVLNLLGLGTKVSVGCAILGMGYGDGLAALVGHSFGKRPLKGSRDKTVVGFLAMAIVTFVVVLAMKLFYGSAYSAILVVLACAATALASALVEAYTPFGLDNLSVPIAIFFLSGLV